MTAGVAVGGVGTASAHVPRRPAQTGGAPTQEARFAPDDGDDGDQFGWSMALDGGTALVCAPTDADPNGPRAGSAYVFERTDGGWEQAAKLAPEDGDSGDFFGTAAALDAGTALVGARRDENPNGPRAGSAYVFERSDGGWEQAAKLAPEGVGVDERFGWAIALAGETALVGTPRDTENEVGAGAVRAFERSDGEWTLQTQLLADDADGGDFFGSSVALSGDTALVGAPGDEDPNGEQSGSAYVFGRDDGGWTQQAKFAPENGDGEDLFGTAVDLAGGTALVTAVHDEDPNGEQGGSAHVFEQSDDGWEQAAKLASGDGAEGDEFGWATALAGETALVGARRHTGNGEDAGAVYAFDGSDSGWEQAAKLVPEDSGEGARVGTSVALDGGTALVGAPGDATETDDGNAETGSVYGFALGEDTPTPSPTRTPTPTPTSSPAPTETPGGDGPGFGVAAALSGLAGWLWWRRSR